MVRPNSTKSNQAAFIEGTLELESGLKINYVAPAHAAPIKENSSVENSLTSVPRKSFMEGEICLIVLFFFATNISMIYI